MPPVRIPGTDQIIFVNEHNGDMVVDLSEYPEVDDAIAKEDITIMGNWTDYSGSGTRGPVEVMLAGIQDVNSGSLKGQLEQSDISRTNRGKTSSTKRQRLKLVYINLDAKGDI